MEKYNLCHKIRKDARGTIFGLYAIFVPCFNFAMRWQRSREFIVSPKMQVRYVFLYVFYMHKQYLTLSALKFASFACFSQLSAFSKAFSISSFITCILFFIASIFKTVKFANKHTNKTLLLLLHIILIWYINWMRFDVVWHLNLISKIVRSTFDNQIVVHRGDIWSFFASWSSARKEVK